jgi:hypothetical protein
MAAEELDRRILKSLDREWRKVVFIVGLIGQDAAVSYDAIAARIAALVEARKLESRGDHQNGGSAR